MTNPSGLVVDLVWRRANGHCQACGRRMRSNGRGWYWSIHHRRSRRIHDRHTDCPCNLILLCGSGTRGCHGYVTEHPRWARSDGWVVSCYQSDPGTVPVSLNGHRMHLTCDGFSVPIGNHALR